MPGGRRGRLTRTADAIAVERQLGRPPRALRRVVTRCPYGLPAVTEQEPYDSAGEPFPTTYYLTCPYAVAVVARAEADGGVEHWSERLASSPELRESLGQATLHQRRLRRELAESRVGPDGGKSLELGIGGSANPLQLKCLHAHVAFALATREYALGTEILGELDPLFPEDRCCCI